MAASPDSLRAPPSIPGQGAPREWFRATASAMRTALEAGEVSSRELADAHLERIAEHGRELGAFAEVFSERAGALAETRDAERAEGRTRGPLHGLPVVLEESFDFENRATTLGVPSRSQDRAKADAAMVRALRDAGAVMLGRANVSQLLRSLETDNPVYGRTSNPFSPRHATGGAAGGAAAAVAAGLTPLALATDAGGSLRIAAHCCAVAGFRPTPGRLASAGLGRAEPREELVPSAPGLMARSVADIELALDALPSARLHELDPRVPPTLEPPSPPASELRIGMFLDDGLLAPSAALIAAVERAADALRAAGATLVPFDPRLLPELFFDAVALLSPDAGASSAALLADGAVAESLRGAIQWARLPATVRNGMARMARVTGDEQYGRLLAAFSERDGTELLEIAARVRTTSTELAASLRKAELDAVLCPAYATPAVPHGHAAELFIASSYSLVWSAAGFPSGVVPVTRVHGSEARRDRVRGRSGRAARRIDEQSAGLPVGVQIVAPPWRDRTVLAALSAIESNVRDDVDFPRTPVG